MNNYDKRGTILWEHYVRKVFETQHSVKKTLVERQGSRWTKSKSYLCALQ